MRTDSMIRGVSAAVCGLLLTAAEAGEFTSALVGRVTYTDLPGWTVSVETKTPEKGVELWEFASRPSPGSGRFPATFR